MSTLKTEKVKFETKSDLTVDVYVENESKEKIILKNSRNMEQAKAYIQELVNLGSDLKNLENHIQGMKTHEQSLKQNIELSARGRTYYERLLKDIYILTKI